MKKPTEPSTPALPDALTAVRQAQEVMRAMHDDPLRDLWAVRRLKRWLDEEEAERVALAREAGHTWDAIGQALGITRQAAQARFEPKGATVRKELRRQCPNCGRASLESFFSANGICLECEQVRSGNPPSRWTTSG
jgi:hypothetical protein